MAVGSSTAFFELDLTPRGIRTLDWVADSSPVHMQRAALKSDRGAPSNKKLPCPFFVRQQEPHSTNNEATQVRIKALLFTPYTSYTTFTSQVEQGLLLLFCAFGCGRRGFASSSLILLPQARRPSSAFCCRPPPCRLLQSGTRSLPT